MKVISTFLFSLLILLTGCGGETGLKSEIAEQEKALEAEANPQTAEALLTNYQTYVADNPGDEELNAKYLYRAGGLAYRLNRFPEAVKLLQRAIRDYYLSDNTPNSVLLLASIYEEKMRNQENALSTYQAFNRAFPENEAISEIKDRLDGGQPPLEDRLQAMRLQMYDDSTGRIQFRVANDFITGSELYAMIMPGAGRVPELLHQAGEAARSIRSFDKALDLYDWLYKKYPDSDRAPQALFLQGFILDNDLKRFEEARVVYTEFLSKYPNDDFADDTEFLLQNLGKDDEEIINSFIQGQETQ